MLWVLTGSLGMVTGQDNPHRVYNVTWVINNLMSGKIANTTSLVGTISDAFPTLYFDLCDLVGDTWDPSNQEPFPGYGCHNPGGRIGTQSKPFYVCPSHKRRKDCGGPADGFCAKWGCETTGTVHWNPSSSWDYITLRRGKTPHGSACYDSRRGPRAGSTPGGKCNPLVLTFTPAGKRATWDGSQAWGLRLYRPGHDPITMFSLIRHILTAEPKLPVGPNPVLSDQTAPLLKIRKPPLLEKETPPYLTSPDLTSPSSMTYLAPSPNPRKEISYITGTSTMNTPTPTTRLLPTSRPGTGDRLLGLIHGAFLALNHSDPNKTQECWLCLLSRPPYYVGTAIQNNYTSHATPPWSCASLPQHRLTISEVSGQGICIGKIPLTHQKLCSKIIPTETSTESKYLTGPNGTYWACNTGLTPCVSTGVLNTSNDFCVLIELWPTIIYHTPEYVYIHSQPQEGIRPRREPVSLTLALLLGGLTVGGITAGIGTGVTALQQTSHFKQLQQAMHMDIQALEESVTALEKSLTSLSEVVLQNRRGLDIIFLQQGGLCAALKEECCFYADHTGVVRDSMAKLRERLRQRQQVFESQQGWFESWFNKSPWLSTLISTIMGPLIILLLILVLGPCVLNRLVQFIKDRLTVIQAMVLTQQYHQLGQTDPGAIKPMNGRFHS